MYLRFIDNLYGNHPQHFLYTFPFSSLNSRKTLLSGSFVWKMFRWLSIRWFATWCVSSLDLSMRDDVCTEKCKTCSIFHFFFLWFFQNVPGLSSSIFSTSPISTLWLTTWDPIFWGRWYGWDLRIWEIDRECLQYVHVLCMCSFIQNMICTYSFVPICVLCYRK